MTSKTILPTLDEQGSTRHPDWHKSTMLASVSYREADSTNGLLVCVLTAAAWQTHPTNIVNGVVRPAPTWPAPAIPANNAPNAIVPACDRALKKYDAHQLALAHA